ncbi:MAG: hypothetical protein ACKVW3_15290 [Phycisphaerales bacterium]
MARQSNTAYVICRISLQSLLPAVVGTTAGVSDAFAQATYCESVAQGTQTPVGGSQPAIDSLAEKVLFIGNSDFLVPVRPSCRAGKRDPFIRSNGSNGWVPTGNAAGLGVYLSHIGAPSDLDGRLTAIGGNGGAPSWTGAAADFPPPLDPLCQSGPLFYYDVIVFGAEPSLVSRRGAYCDPPPHPLIPSHGSSCPSVSFLGARVAFLSGAGGILPPPDVLSCITTQIPTHIYVYDLVLPTVRASKNAIATPGNGASYRPSISGNGRYVAFTSDATNLIEPLNDLNAESDIFVHDLDTGTTRRVSISTSGAEATGGPSDNCSISHSGRFVAFASKARNLAYPSTLTQSGLIHVYVHDRDVSRNGIFDEVGDIRTLLIDVTPTNAEAGTTSPLSVWSYPDISSHTDPDLDGSFITWDSAYRDILPLTIQDLRQVYVRELVSGSFDSYRITIASISGTGSEGNDHSRLPSISQDGRHVVFESDATNLNPSGDFDNIADIYRNDNPVRSCYANCDGSTTPPILNVNDFICFQNRYGVNDPYANCDGSTAPPIFNANDFICYLNVYATGCN